MKPGKVIVIEGTDCSGKETQTTKLLDVFNSIGIKVKKISFPRYETPTGKIIGGPYLGKPEISESFFEEGAANVDPKVASLYYAADRYASLKEINQFLEEGYYVILDRFTYSNMGHQGGKIKEGKVRLEMFNFLDKLEFELLELPRPDLTIFLYMPYQIGMELKKGREGALDGHEASSQHLKMAQEAYLQLCNLYGWEKIDCAPDGTINSLRTIDDISKEVCEKVFSFLNLQCP